jgi:hypothetical protein
MADDESNHDDPKQPDWSPPGHFISDDLRAHTARFLDELKRRLSARKADQEPKLGPPRRRG